MKARSSYAKVVFTAAIIVFLGATSPQDAYAGHSWRTMVGSWVVEITPDPGGPRPFTNLATLNWGGTMISTDADIGTGLGAWKRTGRRDFQLKFLVLIPPGNVIDLPPYGTVIVTADVTVNNSGNVATGRTIGVFFDADGNEIGEVSGGARFTRIKVD